MGHFLMSQLFSGIIKLKEKSLKFKELNHLFVFIFKKTIKTLLLIFSFQDNWLAFMVYARKQVYVIYHQHQPPCISCAEISKSENIKKRCG